MQSRTRTPVRKAPPIAKKSCLKTSHIWSPPLRTLDCAWVGKCRIQTIRVSTHHDMVTEFVNTIDHIHSAVFEMISVDQSCTEKSFRNKSWGVNPLQRGGISAYTKGLWKELRSEICAEHTRHNRHFVKILIWIMSTKHRNSKSQGRARQEPKHPLARCPETRKEPTKQQHDPELQDKDLSTSNCLVPQHVMKSKRQKKRMQLWN